LKASMWRAVSTVSIPTNSTRAFVTVEEPGGSAISIVDLETFEWVATVRTPIPGLSESAWNQVRNRIYVESYLEPVLAVFERLPLMS
jgi:hypothetical protein